jgi:hypothetical protein
VWSDEILRFAQDDLEEKSRGGSKGPKTGLSGVMRAWSGAKHLFWTLKCAARPKYMPFCASALALLPGRSLTSDLGD